MEVAAYTARKIVKLASIIFFHNFSLFLVIYICDQKKDEKFKCYNIMYSFIFNRINLYFFYLF